MSTTLAALLRELVPEISILMIEKLHAEGLESSAAENNAGTGHAANCELNYTPIQPDGTVLIDKALEINDAFEHSLSFWASLAEMGKINPKDFLKPIPHISLVWGESDINFLYQRYKKLRSFDAFSSIEWSTDWSKLYEWMPLIMEGRSKSHSLAATLCKRGTDIDFGSLTSQYLQSLKSGENFEIRFGAEVLNLNQNKDKSWEIELSSNKGEEIITAPFVFIGAGGGSISLLQKSGIPESRDYAGFPISGQWLVCSDEELTNNHNAKVYGKAKVGSPPMSVPHLDSRWIDGDRSLLFGPFAGFSSKFLKNGSYLDLLKSINKTNFAPMLEVGAKNLDLVLYLMKQVRLKNNDRISQLREFLPTVNEKDWKLSIAGQRVQIIKRTTHGGILKMGTEIVSSSDGSIAVLLGASPGASTAVNIMIKVFMICFSEKINNSDWREKLNRLVPSFYEKNDIKNKMISQTRKRNDSLLNLI